MILDSSPADGLVTEVMHAVDGRIIVGLLILAALAVWGWVASGPTADDLLAAHAANEQWWADREQWRAANAADPHAPWDTP